MTFVVNKLSAFTLYWWTSNTEKNQIILKIIEWNLEDNMSSYRWKHIDDTVLDESTLSSQSLIMDEA